MANANAFKASNKPLAKDDSAFAAEDVVGYFSIDDLLANDGAGSAKSFYGIDQSDPRVAATVGTTATTALGATITVRSDGTLSYDSATAHRVQELAAGVTIDDKFSYTIRLGNGMLSTAYVTVTVTGANDAAMIGGQAAGSVTEDTVLTATGALTITDADVGEAHFQAHDAGTPLDAEHGSLTIDAAGNWTYTLNTDDAAVQALDAGAHLADAVVVRALDGTEHTITIDIAGTNDDLYLVGEDSHYGAFIRNVLDGQQGDDTLIGGSAFDAGYVENYLKGSAGEDSIFGGNADVGYALNYMYGDSANDSLTGGSSSNGGYVLNQIMGDDGDDSIFGGNATSGYVENYMYGGSGNDTLTGGSSSNGGWVSNVFSAGIGDDTVYGGGDQSSVELGDLGPGDHIDGGAGHSFLGADGTSNSDSLTIVNGSWFLDGQSLDITSIEQFHYDAGAGDDLVDVSQSGLQHAEVRGGSGNDVLRGGSEQDSFYLSDVNAGDIVSGGAGLDYMYIYNVQDDEIRSYSVDAIDGGLDISGAAVAGVEYLGINLGIGDDSVFISGDLGGSGLVTGTSITVSGSYSGYHIVDASGASNSSYGINVQDSTSDGGDYTGGAGNDTFYTGWGNDAITSGGGNDTIDLWSGGADDLIFAQGSGHDAVYGFTAGADQNDVIDLSAFGFADLESVVAASENLPYGSGSIIHLDSNNDVTLAYVSVQAFASNDFIFHV